MALSHPCVHSRSPLSTALELLKRGYSEHQRHRFYFKPSLLQHQEYYKSHAIMCFFSCRQNTKQFVLLNLGNNSINPVQSISFVQIIFRRFLVKFTHSHGEKQHLGLQRTNAVFSIVGFTSAVQHYSGDSDKLIMQQLYFSRFCTSMMRDLGHC